MNDDDFFEQVTLNICSSFDLSVALDRCFRFLKTQLPLSGLHIDVFQTEQKVMRTLAMISDSRGIRQEMVTPLTQEALDFLVWKREQNPGSSTTWRTDFNNAIVAQLQAPVLGVSGSHLIIQHLVLEGKNLATVVASATPGEKFSAEDERRFALLNEPFGIAVANALSFQKLSKQKDRLLADNADLKQQLGKGFDPKPLDALPGLRQIAKQAARVAASTSTVLLLGETGVGKEIVANAIHAGSTRCNAPFVKVNCGAIAKGLIDSELFGHEKGAFSGASSTQKGYFERADQGTIFLDEIGELPPAAQVRLLRVLQEREIERVGGEQTIPVNLRVIAATHRDLKAMVEKGLFREDLWFRLNVFPVEIPPLRKRREDIPVLLDHFLKQKSFEFGIRDLPEIAPSALSVLCNYDWPGNVRELENAVERALIQRRGRQVNKDRFTLKGGGAQEGDSVNGGYVFTCLSDKENKPRSQAAPLLPLDEQIARHIVRALDQCDGKIHGAGGAAELLAMNPNTLRSKMRKLGIPFH